MVDRRDKVKDILTSMLRDEVDGMETLDGDDWQMRNSFDGGDRVYLRCACYENPQLGDYAWEIQDQTGVELDITDCPEPHEGATAVVECNVTERINAEKLRLGDPKVVAFEVADTTVDELAARL